MGVDVSKIVYSLVAVTPEGRSLYLREVVKDLSWEEYPEELAVRLQAEIHNVKNDGKWLHQILRLGGKVVLWSDWGQGAQEIFRGTIFSVDYRTDPLGSFVITAYDDLRYLTQSQDDRYYRSGTNAKTIIADIAKAWSIPLGRVEGPNIALSKKTFRSQTPAEMIKTVLEEAKMRGAGKFIIRSQKGKIDVIRPGKNTTVYYFGPDVTTMVNDQQDIEELVTRVKIVGQEDKEGRRPVLALVDGDTRFGILQELVYREEYDSPAAAQQAAKQILAERGKPRKVRRVEAPDFPFLRRGDKVHIVAGTLNGYYLISGISHNATTRTMTMEVEEI